VGNPPLTSLHRGSDMDMRFDFAYPYAPLLPGLAPQTWQVLQLPLWGGGFGRQHPARRFPVPFLFSRAAPDPAELPGGGPSGHAQERGPRPYCFLSFSLYAKTRKRDVIPITALPILPLVRAAPVGRQVGRLVGPISHKEASTRTNGFGAAETGRPCRRFCCGRFSRRRIRRGTRQVWPERWSRFTLSRSPGAGFAHIFLAAGLAHTGDVRPQVHAGPRRGRSRI